MRKLFMLLLMLSPSLEGLLAQDQLACPYLKAYVRDAKLASLELPSDDTTPEEKLDSDLREMQDMGIKPYDCLASPDGAFQVYQLEVEYCGAYCHVEYMGRIVTSGRLGEATIPVEGNAIAEIFPLGEGRYLFLKHGWVRPAGFYTQEVWEAQVVRLQGGKMEVLEAFESSLGEGDGTPSSFSIYQENMVDLEMQFRYAPEAKTLHYHYGTFLDVYQGNAGIEEKGAWQWREGRFVQVERTQWARDYGN